MAGRPCTICSHPRRREIEMAAATGEPNRAIARRFVPVTRNSIDRHMTDHAPKAMARAVVAVGGRDLAAGIGLNEEAHGLYDRTLAILEEAERTKKLPVALLAIREARGNLELLGKFTGKLRPDTQVNVLVTSPDWLALRERIADALEPFPDALEAVKGAISGS